jgi:hypothetical protein
MANINISNLSGSDLCNDSDSYLIDITNDAENILGGTFGDAIIRGVKKALLDLGLVELTVGEPIIIPEPKK